MSDKHQFEQLRETFFTNLGELDLDTPVHNDVVAKLDRSINQVLMGVSVNGAPKKKELTRGQKIAASRKRNKARKEAEENNETAEDRT